jgi:predicted CoA-binding protein
VDKFWKSMGGCGVRTDLLSIFVFREIITCILSNCVSNEPSKTWPQVGARAETTKSW